MVAISQNISLLILLFFWLILTRKLHVEARLQNIKQIPSLEFQFLGHQEFLHLNLPTSINSVSVTTLSQLFFLPYLIQLTGYFLGINPSHILKIGTLFKTLLSVLWNLNVT